MQVILGTKNMTSEQNSMALCSDSIIPVSTWNKTLRRNQLAEITEIREITELQKLQETKNYTNYGNKEFLPQMNS